MLNELMTCPSAKFKQEDGSKGMTQLQLDQCLAELCYLKRAIDTLIQFSDAERAMRIFE